jgi:hypothetical protein
MSADAHAIMAAQKTVSGRIRALAQTGLTRSEIAKLVGRSYQQVRQVLVEDERRRLRQDYSPAASPGLREDPSAFAGPAPIIDGRAERVQLDADGRLLLTPTLIEALDARPGEWVIATVDENGSVALLSARAAMKQAQAIIRRFVPAGVSLVDELLAERRAEAERETRGE